MSEEIPVEFDFQEHILQIPDLTERIERLERIASSGFSFLIRPFLGLRLEHLKRQQSYAHNQYDDLKSFFEMTSANPRNKVLHYQECKFVLINGSGTETIRCNGEPVFYRSKQDTEETLIPVKIGDDEAWIRIPRYPQLEFSPFDDFEVDYSFETRFSLGYPIGDHFTKRLLKTHSTFEFKPTFCGEPGRVYYRFSDALYDELNDAMFGNHHRPGTLPNDDWSGRKKLNLYGKIHVKGSGGLLYQGNFKCYNTSFPFFVRREESGDRNPSPNPVVSNSIV